MPSHGRTSSSNCAPDHRRPGAARRWLAELRFARPERFSSAGVWIAPRPPPPRGRARSRGGRPRSSPRRRAAAPFSTITRSARVCTSDAARPRRGRPGARSSRADCLAPSWQPQPQKPQTSAWCSRARCAASTSMCQPSAVEPARITRSRARGTLCSSFTPSALPHGVEALVECSSLRTPARPWRGPLVAHVVRRAERDRCS